MNGSRNTNLQEVLVGSGSTSGVAFRSSTDEAVHRRPGTTRCGTQQKGMGATSKSSGTGEYSAGVSHGGTTSVERSSVHRRFGEDTHVDRCVRLRLGRHHAESDGYVPLVQHDTGSHRLEGIQVRSQCDQSVPLARHRTPSPRGQKTWEPPTPVAVRTVTCTQTGRWEASSGIRRDRWETTDPGVRTSSFAARAWCATSGAAAFRDTLAPGSQNKRARNPLPLC